jgi:WD40 repeat protein
VSPLAIVASNDKHLRILDCKINAFIYQDALSRAINCIDTDGRLRVIIGDSPDAWVTEAETRRPGGPVQTLRGHRDFGSACAWSPAMLQIATSNQDKTVNIRDVRTWRLLQSIDSDVAGYRSLRFFPVGGGPRTLLMCEPADHIAIVNT